MHKYTSEFGSVIPCLDKLVDFAKFILQLIFVNTGLSVAGNYQKSSLTHAEDIKILCLILPWSFEHVFSLMISWLLKLEHKGGLIFKVFISKQVTTRRASAVENSFFLQRTYLLETVKLSLNKLHSSQDSLHSQFLHQQPTVYVQCFVLSCSFQMTTRIANISRLESIEDVVGNHFMQIFDCVLSIIDSHFFYRLIPVQTIGLPKEIVRHF